MCGVPAAAALVSRAGLLVRAALYSCFSTRSMSSSRPWTSVFWWEPVEAVPQQVVPAHGMRDRWRHASPLACEDGVAALTVYWFPLFGCAGRGGAALRAGVRGCGRMPTLEG